MNINQEFGIKLPGGQTSLLKSCGMIVPSEYFAHIKLLQKRLSIRLYYFLGTLADESELDVVIVKSRKVQPVVKKTQAI